MKLLKFKILCSLAFVLLVVGDISSAAPPTPPAGTYGSSTQVGQFTVDAKGKMSSATNVNIEFPINLDSAGHIFFTGNTPSWASCSHAFADCTPGDPEFSIIGTDNAGTITINDPSESCHKCTFNFGTPYSTPPSCLVSSGELPDSDSPGPAIAVSTTATQITLSTGQSGGWQQGQVLSYHCVALP